MDGTNSTQISSAASTKRKGKQCSSFGCSNSVYGAEGSLTHFHFFHIPRDAKQRRRWCNRIKRQHGKNGFFVTNSTVVCSKHFRKEDARNSLTGHRFLVPSLLFGICLCLTPVCWVKRSVKPCLFVRSFLTYRKFFDANQFFAPP